MVATMKASVPLYSVARGQFGIAAVYGNSPTISITTIPPRKLATARAADGSSREMPARRNRPCSATVGSSRQRMVIALADPTLALHAGNRQRHDLHAGVLRAPACADPRSPNRRTTPPMRRRWRAGDMETCAPCLSRRRLRFVASATHIYAEFATFVANVATSVRRDGKQWLGSPTRQLIFCAIRGLRTGHLLCSA